MNSHPGQCEAVNYTTDQQCTLPDGHETDPDNTDGYLHQDANANQWETHDTTHRGRHLRITGTSGAVTLQGFFAINTHHVINHRKPTDLGNGFTQYQPLHLEPPLITINSSAQIPIRSEPVRIELWTHIDGQCWGHFTFPKITPPILDHTNQDMINYRARSITDAETPTFLHIQITDTPPPETT